MRTVNVIEGIFFAALEKKTPADRDAYLDQACAGDPELRRCVERMLDAQPKIGDFLQPPTPPATIEHPPIEERPGSIIGPYKLLQQLGEGGFGVVFMAEQEKPVRRKVALKIIKPGMDSRQVVARFEAERQALAIMDHPNIARVLDGGMTNPKSEIRNPKQIQSTKPKSQNEKQSDVSPIGALDLPVVSDFDIRDSDLTTGRPYFVMELVKGIPITEFCDKNRLTPRERLELFIPICQAVQHAHQKGIIHRDIKPSNVLVTMYDDKPVPKVIDFGIAKAIEQKLTEHTLFTTVGQIIGTLEYMSPEQASLNALDVDTRADVYALGVLLYELLTGTTPLNKERLQGVAFLEMLRLIREEEPPRPSTRLTQSGDALSAFAAYRRSDSQKLPKLVKGELDWIAMKALEKDRTRRYDTAYALARDVQRYLDDDVVEARPPSAAYRLRKFARRHKGQVLAALVVLLALIGGMIGTSWGLVQAEGARVIAVAAQVEAGKKTQVAVAARQQADDALKDTTDAYRKLEIEQKKTQAEQAKLRAEQELTARLLYASRINRAATALVDNRRDLLANLLEETTPKPHEPDLRGWEWYYLRRQNQLPVLSELRVGKDDGIFHVTPDGRWVLSSPKAKGWLDIDVWAVKTGKRVGRVPRIAQLTPELDEVDFSENGSFGYSMLGSPVLCRDGRFLAAWKLDDNFNRKIGLRMWRVDTGEEVPVPAIVVNPNDGGDLVLGPDAAWIAWTEGRPLSPLPALGASTIGLMSSPFGETRFAGMPTLFRGKIGIAQSYSLWTGKTPYNSAWEVTVARWERTTGVVSRKSFATYLSNARLSSDGQTAFVFPDYSYGEDNADTLKNRLRAIDLHLQGTFDDHLECWDLTAEKPRLREPVIPLFDKGGRSGDVQGNPSGDAKLSGPGDMKRNSSCGVKLSPGRTAAAVLYGNQLTVYRLPEGQMLWRTVLPDSTSTTEAILANVSDDGNRLLFHDWPQLRILEKPVTQALKGYGGGFKKSPKSEGSTARTLVFWPRGHALALRGRLTADGGALVADDPDGVYSINMPSLHVMPMNIQGRTDFRLVRVLDISRDHSLVDSVPGVDVNDNRIQALKVQLPETGSSGGIRTLLGEGRLLVHDIQVQPMKVPGSKGPPIKRITGWSLYNIDDPGEAKKIAGGDGTVEAAPDGTCLVAKTGRRVTIYDLKMGEQVGKVDIPDGMGVKWPTPRIGQGSRGSHPWPLTQSGSRLALVTWPIPKTVARPNFSPGWDLTNKDPLPLTLRMYDTKTGEQLWTTDFTMLPAESMQVMPGDVMSEFGPLGFPPNLMFSPDGRHAYVSFRVEKDPALPFDSSRVRITVKRIMVISMKDGTVERTIGAGTETITDHLSGNLAGFYGLAPDGRLVVVRKDQVQLWNPDTGNMDLHMQVHDGLEKACFSPDGSRLFVIAHDVSNAKQERRLSVWDLATKSELLDIPLPGRPRFGINDIPFRLDDDKPYIGAQDGIRVYDGSPK